MIESLSQLYRAAAPIQPWLIFLFESYSGSEKMVGVILSAVYIVAKSTDLLDRVKFCRRSFVKLLQKTVSIVMTMKYEICHALKKYGPRYTTIRNINYACRRTIRYCSNGNEQSLIFILFFVVAPHSFVIHFC